MFRKIKFILIPVIFVFCTVAVGAEEKIEIKSQQPAAVDPRNLKFPPLEFKMPQAERLELKNGMVIYLLPDKVLPMLNFQAVIRVGEIYEPTEKAGLAALTGVVLREGGTEKMSSEELNRKLEYLAASVGTSVSRENGSANLFVLKEHLDEALEIYADILRRPAFEQEKIDKRKKELAEIFRRENDEPDDIVGRKFRELIYHNHPYQRRIIGYADTVEKIERSDVIDFYKNFFKPNNIILGISGDFERDQILKKVEALFGDWKKKKIKFPKIKKIPYEFEQKLYFIEKDITQSNFFLSHLGVHRLHPDYFNITVMNYILGSSGFGSRLVDNVRSAAGLAYAVGSYIHFPRFRGFFLCYCQTKTEKTHEAVKKIIEELERIRKEPVSDEEFASAKEALKNQFVFRFQTSAQVLQQLIYIEYEGLPEDYLETYLEKINGVTLEDVQEAAEKHIHPDRLTLVLVGHRDALETFPKDFGVFTEIKLEDDDE